MKKQRPIEQRRRGLGLGGRSIAMCVGLVLGTAGALLALNLYQFRQDSKRKMTYQAVIYVQSLAEAVEAPLLLGDDKTVARILQGARHDPAVLAACVLDARGQTVASLQLRPLPLGQMLLDGFHAPNAAEPLRARVIERTPDTLQAIEPVYRVPSDEDFGLVADPQAKLPGADRPVGYVWICYGFDGLRAETMHHLLTSALTAAGVAALGIVITLLLVRQVLNPIQDLVETSSVIADGNLSKRVKEACIHPICVLARSFNHMADRLQDSYESIERTVQARTAELVRANRSKTDFLANMSHEIRTPLTAVLGFSEALSTPNLSDAERYELVTKIHSNGKHLAGLINGILDLTDLEASRLQVHPTSTPLVPVLAEVCSVYRCRAESKGLQFEIDFPTELPETIVTDENRLRQILAGLVDNAVKFTDRGTVAVSVCLDEPPNHIGEAPLASSTEDVGPEHAPRHGGPTGPEQDSERSNGTDRDGDQDHPRLRFVVRDTGVGIEGERLDAIFKPFTQADETMSRRFGGMGSGLALCKKLAQMLGGDVSIESEPACGSTLTVTIDPGSLAGVRRIQPSEALANIPASTPPSKEAKEPASESLDARVLLVEDGRDNQRLLSFVLTKAGAEVLIACNGQEAL